MSINNYRYYYACVVFISLVYSYLTNSGFYGFNIDFYKEYSKSNLFWEYSLRDRLGVGISTLTIFNKHIGVGITSFLLSISSGFLLISMFQIKKLNSVFIFLIIYLMLLHIHPIIMSTSGAMRQGIGMSLIFMSFFFYFNKKKFLSFLFFFISIFMHRSLILFFFIYLFTIFILKFLKYFHINIKILILIFAGFLIFFLNSLLILFFETNLSSRVIYGDFRLAWLIINLSFIFIFLIYLIKDYLFIIKFEFVYLYFFSSFAPSFYYMGLNWQYERINMVVSILYIFFLGLFFNKRSAYIYYSTAILVYLLLTIYQGMFSIGLV